MQCSAQSPSHPAAVSPYLPPTYSRAQSNTPPRPLAELPPSPRPQPPPTSSSHPILPPLPPAPSPKKASANHITHPRQARQDPPHTAPSPSHPRSRTVLPSDWPEKGPDRPTRDDVIGGGATSFRGWDAWGRHGGDVDGGCVPGGRAHFFCDGEGGVREYGGVSGGGLVMGGWWWWW